MSYTISFEDSTVDPVTKAPITVPVGTVNTTATSIALTGKGAANFGELQQTNLVHLLENFASGTAPTNPTIGQLWYDSVAGELKMLVSAAPQVWKAVGAVQISPTVPTPATLGSLWFQPAGSASGFLYVYTGIGRYPQVGSTIGGWDQIYPQVETVAGREEYDQMRQLLDRLIGFAGVQTFSSGAIGRSVTNLTDFGSLDNDLRTKYAALTPLDQNVLISPSSDLGITIQAPSNNTLFYFLDANNPEDGIIGGLGALSEPDPTVDGTILVNGVLTTVPHGYFYHKFQVENAFIVWDQTSTLIACDGGTGTPLPSGTYAPYFVCQQAYDGSWTYDNNYSGAGWIPFTPVSGMYVIGQISSYAEDTLLANNLVYPLDKSATMWAHAVPLFGTKLEHLKVETNSNDWDTLLAAARYAINRLEVPPSYITSISDQPFVSDGLQIPASLQGLSASDVRNPSAGRRAGRKGAIVSLIQDYAETLNALNTAIQNKFSLRGINGFSGSNPYFESTTAVNLFAPSSTAGLSAVMSSGAGSARIQFRFASMDEMNRFLGCGGGLQIAITHAGGANTVDGNFRTMLSTMGNLRITADKIRVLGQSTPIAVTQPMIPAGIWNANVPGKTLATLTSLGISMTITAFRVSNSQFDLQIGFNGGSAFAGTTAIAISEIIDTETYGASLAVYPAPLPFQASDVVVSLGSGQVVIPTYVVVETSSAHTAFTQNTTINNAGVSASNGLVFNITGTPLATITNVVVTSGAIPPGTSFSLSGANAYLAGVPSTAGSFSAGVNVTYTYPGGGPVTEPHTVTSSVTAQTVTYTYLPNVFLNNTYQLGSTLTTSGQYFTAGAVTAVQTSYFGSTATLNPAWDWTCTVTAGSLPPGISLTKSGQGTYYYTGTVLGSAGAYVFNIHTVGVDQWNNAINQDTSVTFTVSQGVLQTPTVIQSVGFPLNSLVSGAYATQIVGTLSGGYCATVVSPSITSLTLGSGSLPPGISLVVATPNFFYQGTATVAGTYTYQLDLVATDSWNNAVLFNYVVTANVA